MGRTRRSPERRPVRDANALLRNNSRLPFSDAFFNTKTRYFLRKWDGCMRTTLTRFADVPLLHDLKEIARAKTDAATSEGDRYLWMEEGHVQPRSLPDDILIQIFRLLDTFDRVHIVALVCKQWMQVVFTKNVWTQLFVKSLERKSSTIRRAAKAFLQKVSPLLRRLCISCDPNIPLQPIKNSLQLPERFEHLTQFELSANRVFTLTEFRALNRSMPMLRCLMLADQGDRYYEKPRLLNIDLFNAEKLFKNLRSLSLILRGYFIEGTESFLSQRPLLEAFKLGSFPYNSMTLDWLPKLCLQRIDAYAAENASKNQDVENFTDRGNLKKLSLADCPRIDSEYLSGLPLERLEFLELTSEFGWWEDHRGPFDFTPLRNLHHLKHLHLKKFPNCEYASLFEAASNETRFPHCLRYLDIERCDFPAAEVEQIATSCPDLRAFRCNCDYKESSDLICFIAHSMKKLQFLGVDRMKHFVETVQQLGDEAFPELRVIFATKRDQTPLKEDDITYATLFKLRPALVAWNNREFKTYRRRFANGKTAVISEAAITKEETEKIYESLVLEEGFCCVHDEFYTRPG